jgi:hypothetical protein
MRYHATARVCDHLLWLLQRSELDLIFPPTGVPGFVHFGEGGAIISTGISGGLVEVAVDVLDEAPPVELDGWEDVDEGDVATGRGGIRLIAGYEMRNYIPGGSGALTPEGPSLHRVRVSARGRGDHYDAPMLDAPPTEAYLIQMWPTVRRNPTVVHKRTSGR